MKKKILYNWLMPLLLASSLFICVRIANDVPRNINYWVGNSLAVMLSEVLPVIIASYLIFYLQFIWIKRIRKKRWTVWVEYGGVIAGGLILSVVVIFIGRLFSNRPFDILASVNDVVVGVLFISLFYTFMRSWRLEKEYDKQRLLLERIRNDQLQTELKFLRSQYHPHFLFNALNTVYFQIDEKNEAPRRTIEMLSDLLRYQLYGGNQKVPVLREIDYLHTYMNMQKLRMSERLKLNVSFSPSLLEQPVYPLLFLPMVENAFKFVGGEYRIDCRMTDEAGKILFEITNSLPSLPAPANGKKGIGLENLKRRLTLLYPEKHILTIRKEAERYSVKLMIEIDML